MSLPHTSQSITDYDLHAIQQRASALRAQFLHAYAIRIWNRIRHGRTAVADKTPQGAAHA